MDKNASIGRIQNEESKISIGTVFYMHVNHMWTMVQKRSRPSLKLPNISINISFLEERGAHRPDGSTLAFLWIDPRICSSRLRYLMKSCCFSSRGHCLIVRRSLYTLFSVLSNLDLKRAALFCITVKWMTETLFSLRELKKNRFHLTHNW